VNADRRFLRVIITLVHASSNPHGHLQARWWFRHLFKHTQVRTGGFLFRILRDLYRLAQKLCIVMSCLHIGLLQQSEVVYQMEYPDLGGETVLLVDPPWLTMTHKAIQWEPIGNIPHDIITYPLHMENTSLGQLSHTNTGLKKAGLPVRRTKNGKQRAE
jgi:hypothetical protein